MRGSAILYCCLLLLPFTGCIKNDYPLPTVKAEILELVIEGAQSVKIDDATNTVTVKVADTLDLKDMTIKKLLVTDKVTVIPDEKACKDFVNFPDTGFTSLDYLPSSANTHMDFRKPVSFILRLYQDYEWKVNVTHAIDRKIRVKNQIGKALVDENTKNVIIYVDKESQPSFRNVEIEELQLGSSIAETVPEPQSVTDFTRPRVFLVSVFGETEQWTVSVKYPSGDIETTEVSAWAKRTYFSGTTKRGEVDLKYRVKGEEEWEYMLSGDLTVDGETFLAVITHLHPGTTYEYILTIDGSAEEMQEFTTEKMEEVPNMGFDNWISANGTVYPNLDLESNYFWDSGNGGAKTAGKIPTEEEKRNVVKGSAANLHSEYAMVAFAAGNIYTGKFVKAIVDLANPGAELDFGRPYVGRPSGMRGYYSYRPGTIDYAQGAYADMMGQKDSCHIYIALFDWTQPFRVNTQKSLFVDLSWSNESMIAFGEFKTGATNTDYSTFKINMKYRDYFTKPTYILIVASASKYGDYFTGSTKSVLLLDEFELVFE
ncbi:MULTISPECIES: PCMD domain-containing protein [Parabacteroides]|uniref:PCMD domain-containing protein n=1 Tax=Parabacteroides provencensis TaxID=1944636 RepID=UPI000C145BFB|nr:PCMD domain-containing protein [Parabacteroides provencensis]